MTKKSMTKSLSSNVVVIGGGTGNSTLLAGLKPRVGDGLSSIVAMADDGGSTRILRDEYGTLPPGDLRQCLIALSNSPQHWREMFGYRFGGGRINPEGGLSGHTVGNLIITAAEELAHNDIVQAVNLVGELLSITGQVIPVTADNRRLVITSPDGQVIHGEHEAEMTHVASLRGASVSFDKSPTVITPEALKAISEAAVTVIAPGDLYTSIAPALVVSGMREALAEAACVVMVINLMNRDRHTVGFTALDYVQEVERMVGNKVIDCVVFNTQTPTKEALDKYTDTDYHLVDVDQDALREADYKVYGRPLLSNEEVKTDPNDALAHTRSLIRHDPERVADVIVEIAETYGR